MASVTAEVPMTQAPKLTYPVLFNFAEASVAYAAKMQRLNEVSIDAFKQLSLLRNQANAEGCGEGFSHMVSISGAQGPSGLVAGWPPLIQASLSREAKLQQRSLEIWALTLQTTLKLYSENAGTAPPGANGLEASVAEGVPERRVSSRVIKFPDRRAAAFRYGVA